jgi:hypothetical protein
MDMVYAVDSAQIAMPDGSLALIRKGEPRRADDPLVRFKPMLFTDEPERPLPTSIGPDGSPVEAATAVPGEKRNVRR